MREIGIRAHVGGILAAEFEARGGKASRGRGDDGPAARHRTGETHARDPPIAQQARSIGMRQVQVLEHPGGNARTRERLEEALGAQRRLVRRFEHHRIAGNQGRQHGIDRRQVGVIPGRDHRDHAKRHSLDLPLEARLGPWLNRGERFGRHSQHVACALLEAADLAGRVADGTSHLPGDLRGDVVRLGDKGVDRPAENSAALRERHGSPGPLCALRGAERPIDVGGRRERPFDIDSAVDRTDGLQRVGH